MNCPKCKTPLVDSIITYDDTWTGGDKVHKFKIDNVPVQKCPHCGEIVFDMRSNDAIARGIRSEVGLLQPEDIKAARERSQLSISDLNVLASANIEQIEEGLRIHTREIDADLRQILFPVLDLEQIRDALLKVGILADLEEGEYKLRFGSWLVLTQNNEVTWEPAEPCSTPRYVTLDPDSPKFIHQLIALSDAWDKELLPKSTELGNDAGVKILDDLNLL